VPSAASRLITADWIPILLSQVFALGCGLLAVRLTSEWVPPDVYGVYGLFLTFVPLGWMVTHAGLIKHASRHWPGHPNQIGYLAAWARAALSPSGLLAGAGGAWALGSALIAPGTTVVAMLVVPAAIAGAASQAAQLSLQAARRYWTDFALTALHASTRSFLPLAAVAIAGASFPVLGSAFVVHALIVAIVGWLVLQAASRPGREPAQLDTTGYQRAFAWSGLLALVNAGLLRWVAGLCYDATTVGHLTLAGNLGLVLPNVIAGACSQYFYPRLVAHAHDAPARTRVANEALAVYAGATILAAIALHFLLPWLPGHLVADRYADSLPFVLPVFALGASLGGLALLQNELLAAERERAIAPLATTFTLLLAVVVAGAATLSLAALRIGLLLTPVLVAGTVGLATRRALRR
jgi:hypothetical protein